MNTTQPYSRYQKISEIDVLTEENQRLKERFDFYKSRFNDISKKPAPYSFPKKSSALKEALSSAVQKLEVLKREKESFLIQKVKNPQDLEDQKLFLEGKLKQLKAENDSLKLKKSLKNSENASIEKDLLAEIENYKKKIESLETQHEKNIQILRNLKENKRNFGKFESGQTEQEEADKELEKLWKIERNLKSSLKSNDLKYKQMLKELETTAEKLAADKVCLQMKILKTSQQERLLQMTIDKTATDSEHNFNDANFLYRPSLKGLYH